MGWVYFIAPDAPSPIKIGWTGKHPAGRLANLQLGNPQRLRLIGEVEAPEALEAYCHARLGNCRVLGEWFERQPALDLLLDLQLAGSLKSPRALASFERQNPPTNFLTHTTRAGQ